MSQHQQGKEMEWIADTQEEARDLKLRPYLNGDL